MSARPVQWGLVMDLPDVSPEWKGPAPWVGPRERALESGFESLGDADLLAIVLGTGVSGQPVMLVAAALLHRFAGLDGLSRVGPGALAQHPGVGLAKALRIAASVELGRRVCQQSLRMREPMRTSAHVATYFAPRLAHLDHEEMWVAALDGRNALRGVRKVSQGGLHGCAVSARDILRAALADAASSILLVHNHPSGDPTPSLEDLGMTKMVSDAAAVVGTPLVDHVILGASGRYTSLLDLGVLSA